MKSFIVFLIVSVYLTELSAQDLSAERVERAKAATVMITLDSINKMGSAFYINAEGHIATCWHVIEPAAIRNDKNEITGFKKIFILGKTGKRQTYSVPRYFYGIGYKLALIYDYCMLVPDAEVTTPTPFLKIGKFSTVKEGDEIYTCGYPLGIPQQFISRGIVSTKYSDTITLSDASRYSRNVMLMDLTLNRGNSGGPILKVGETALDDEVIAMADFIVNPTGGNINYVIDKLKSSGGISIQGFDTNLVLGQLLEYLSSTSVGVSGGMSIDYFYNGWKK